LWVANWNAAARLMSLWATMLATLVLAAGRPGGRPGPILREEVGK
jgi:hypothetical protein